MSKSLGLTGWILTIVLGTIIAMSWFEWQIPRPAIVGAGPGQLPGESVTNSHWNPVSSL